MNLCFCCRFDIGPILSQELYEVPEKSTADELGGSLAVLGAQLVNTGLCVCIYVYLCMYI